MKICPFGGEKQLVPTEIIAEMNLAGFQVYELHVGGTKQAAVRFTIGNVLLGLHERIYPTGDRGYLEAHDHLRILGRDR